MSEDILAIVGSQTWPEPHLLHTARNLLTRVLDATTPDLVISGGAQGIDTLARELSEARYIPFLEFLPQNRRWQPTGFKARNERIADACTRMVVIRHAQSRTFGSGWTAQHTAGLGKPVDGWILHPDGRIWPYPHRQVATLHTSAADRPATPPPSKRRQERLRAMTYSDPLWQQDEDR